MSNFLVETKNEYTTHLSNILTPLIFEGLQSIYRDAMKNSTDDDILKVFQSFLRGVPKWNQVMIDTETNRIINSSKSYGWLNDLIKATLKANLVILMYNPTCKKQEKIDPAFYQNIKTSDFIHKVYIECARELWNNPYLLKHDYEPLEIKRNQRDCMHIIKDCIKEAVRKLLPVKHILQIYLGEEIDINRINNDDVEVDKAMTDIEKENLGKIIQKDLSGRENNQMQNPQLEYKSNSPLHMNKNNYDSPVGPNMRDNMPNNMMGGNNVTSNSDDKTIGSKILNIINNSPQSHHMSESLHMTGSATSSDTMVKKFETAMNHKDQHAGGNKTLDDKLKHILKKDLATDSDIETSLNYSQEENSGRYQEIFSNSNVEKPKLDNSKDKNKNKYFNNYMQF